MSVDLVGIPIEISGIAAYTGLPRSSVYNTVDKMEEKKLVTINVSTYRYEELVVHCFVA